MDLKRLTQVTATASPSAGSSGRPRSVLPGFTSAHKPMTSEWDHWCWVAWNHSTHHSCWLVMVDQHTIPLLIWMTFEALATGGTQCDLTWKSQAICYKMEFRETVHTKKTSEPRTHGTIWIVWSLACPHSLQVLLFPGILKRIVTPASPCERDLYKSTLRA